MKNKNLFWGLLLAGALYTASAAAPTAAYADAPNIGINVSWGNGGWFPTPTTTTSNYNHESWREREWRERRLREERERERLERERRAHQRHEWREHHDNGWHR